LVSLLTDTGKKKHRSIGLEITDPSWLKALTAEHFILRNLDYHIALRWKNLKAQGRTKRNELATQPFFIFKLLVCLSHNRGIEAFLLW